MVRHRMGIVYGRSGGRSMIQFIAGAIFGAVVGFMILAIVTAGRDK